jgi:hypothetical protein
VSHPNLVQNELSQHPTVLPALNLLTPLKTERTMHENNVTDPITDQELHRRTLCRDRVLARLWQIADLDPAITRNSASAQIKALAMIVAIEALIPDRRAVAPQKQSAAAPANPPFYVAAWKRNQRNGETANSDPSPDPAVEEVQQQAVTEVQSAHGAALDLGVSAVAGPSNPVQATVSNQPPMSAFVPDSRIAFSINKNRFGRRR